MARVAAPVVVKPSDTVYTAMLLVGIVAAVIGIIIVFMRAKAIFPDGQGLL